MGVLVGRDMRLQPARSAGDRIGQCGGLRGLEHRIAALQPRTVERLEPGRREGSNGLIELIFRISVTGS